MENDILIARIRACGIDPSPAMQAKVIELALKKVPNSTIRQAFREQTKVALEAEKAARLAEKERKAKEKLAA